MAHQIDHAKPDENALFLMMQTIPCILHCSNRVNLKLLTLILQDGLVLAKEKKILSEHAGVVKRIDTFLLDAEYVLNTEILGTHSDPAQFHIPTKEGTKKSETEISAISMENGRTLKVIDKLELLVDYCLPPDVTPEKNIKWKQCLPHYRAAMKFLRQKKDFTDSEIIEFQKHFDLFFQTYIGAGMYGSRGMTNYIHLLSSGHMSDYLKKWRNLYIHSQQGWESLNNMMKIFFFRRTGRGGGKYTKSKLKPLARWLQRRLIWLCGYNSID